MLRDVVENVLGDHGSLINFIIIKFIFIIAIGKFLIHKYKTTRKRDDIIAIGGFLIHKYRTTRKRDDIVEKSLYNQWLKMPF